MKAIRLVYGHFDGTTEAGSTTPAHELHKKLPHGEWVNAASGQTVTHDIYRLTTNEQQERQYVCEGRAIEKATWLLMNKLKQAPQTS